MAAPIITMARPTAASGVRTRALSVSQGAKRPATANSSADGDDPDQRHRERRDAGLAGGDQAARDIVALTTPENAKIAARIPVKTQVIVFMAIADDRQSDPVTLSLERPARSSEKGVMEELRPLLLSIAYRMLGSFGDAEDVVQEAYLRLHREDAGGVAEGVPDHGDDPAGDRSAAVGAPATRDLPRSVAARAGRRRVRRPRGSGRPVGLAVHRVPRRTRALSPDQRAVFLLCDVFGYSYDEVAGIIAKTPAACRQLAVRARRRIADNRPRYDASPQERDELVRRFVAAAEDGELDALVDLLAPDATFTGDGGGKGGFPRPVHGAGNVSPDADRHVRQVRRTLGWLSNPCTSAVSPHSGSTTPADRTVAIWSFVVTEGLITTIHGVVNPDKLTHLQSSGHPHDQG